MPRTWGSPRGHSWACALQTAGPPRPPAGPGLLGPPRGHKRRRSSVQESSLPSCCRTDYAALRSSIAANIVIFETCCASHTVKIGQLAQQRERGGWTNIPGFQPCFPRKGLSLSAYSSKLYQFIEMWFFRLKLWLFFKNKTAQSTSIFIKCPLHIFRAHFNETSTLISYIFFFVQPVWLQDSEQKFTHFVHLQNSFPNFSYKTFSLIFWDIKCPQLFVNTVRIKQMSHKIRALTIGDNDPKSLLLHRFSTKCVIPGYRLTCKPRIFDLVLMTN